MVSGEELEMRMKMKAITANVVKAHYESKLGIASSAYQFVQQAFNFWQLTGSVFGDDSWFAKITGLVYKQMELLRRELESIAENDKDYILQIALIWNNEYHLFLTSCIEANDDIQKVRWNRYDALPDTLSSLIQTRTKPSFVLTTCIRLIAEQSKLEAQQKRNAENAFGAINAEGKKGGNKNRNKWQDGADIGGPPEREE
jgi:hypothetical protein